jgi:ATP-binding cassette subfamily B protein
MHFVSRHNLIETKLLQSKNKLLFWCRDILEKFNNKQILVEKYKTIYSVSSEIIYLLGFAFCFYLIFKDVLSGSILLGSMIYILRTLDSTSSFFVSFIDELSFALEDSMTVGDLLKFFNTKPFIKKAENPVDLDLTSPPDIVFENVSFKYPNQKNEKYVLRNLNLTFKGGFKIGLVGNNGAGKTTLVKLLCRIYDPTEGRILINGVDLKDVDFEKWWGYISVMLQDYASYDFTVKQAIAIGRAEKDIDEDLVIKSAEISQASEFIEKWENKYDHQIGVEFKGVEPSKGQRQKLAIAKTLYRNAFVMILDEPTASVDAESESKIFKSLSELPNNQTSILISHDFSMIKECDHIIVLKEGMLFEEGKHKDLMKKKGLYEELFKIQADGFK